MQVLIYIFKKPYIKENNILCVNMHIYYIIYYKDKYWFHV